MGLVRGRSPNTLFDGGRVLEPEQIANSKLNRDEYELRKSELKAYPRRLVLEITNSCNLICLMCQGSRNGKTLHRLNFKDFCWFEPLFNVVEEVTLFGVGEPTMNPDFPKMLEKLDDYPVRKYFCTNGTMPEKYKNAIFDYHVDNFAVSIDRVESKTDTIGHSFSDVWKHLKDVVDTKKIKNVNYPHIRIVCCLMKDNLNELPDLVDKAIETGVNEVRVVYFTAFKNEDKDKEQILREQILWNDKDKVETIFNQLKEKSEKMLIYVPHIPGKDPADKKLHNDCEMAWRDLFIGADGKIRPCMSSSERFLEASKKLFDESKSLDDVWNGSEFQNHRRTVNDEEEMSKYCKTCYQASHANWNKRYAFDQCGIS